MTETLASETRSSGSPNRDADSPALSWWRRLADPRTGDPGTLARLRRARSPFEASVDRASVTLAKRLGAINRSMPDWRLRAAIDLSRVLAHVKEHDPLNHPMRAAGWGHFAGNRKESEAGDDRPRLAEARFRRLLQTGDGEEKVAAFTRLVALLGGTVNVTALANDFLRWNDPVRGDRIREYWAFQYYAAGEAAPPAQDDVSTNSDEEGDV